MRSATIIFQQIVIMYIYIAVGYTLYKKKAISREASAGFANFLIYIILPCVILQSFCTERTGEKIQEFIWSFVWGLVVLLIAMCIAALIYKKRPIDNFGAAFSNAGFMGIPLITAMLGHTAVFYVASMIAALNIFQWFYGQGVLAGKKIAWSWKGILLNPLIISLLLGTLLFLTGCRPPGIVMSCVENLASMNAPVAMTIMGVYLAQTDLKTLFTKKEIYLVSAVRLLLIPIATLLILAVVPGLTYEMRTALLIAACAPIGANVAVYAQKLNKDYIYAVETVCMSTIFSIVTMPLIIMMAEKFM